MNFRDLGYVRTVVVAASAIAIYFLAACAGFVPLSPNLPLAARTLGSTDNLVSSAASSGRGGDSIDSIDSIDSVAAEASKHSVTARSPDTVWTIEAGTYAGMKVPLHIAAAFGGRGKREHFWRVASGRGRDGGVVGWKSTRYPIPLAFRHERRSQISSADSSAFWRIVDAMSADFGMEMFHPSTLANDDPDDVIVVDIGGPREVDGLSRATWTAAGELSDVRVTFRDASVLHDSHVVTHEMIHALGFGHTTSWRSVVNPNGGSRPPRVTAEDVAYSELAMRSRVTDERVDMRRLVALAVSRESSRFKGDVGYVLCDHDGEDTFEVEEPMRIRGFLPFGLLTVVSACGAGEKKGPDTIAVPAAAVDTTTDRVAGATPRAEAKPATGVDTPITRKLGSPAPAKKY